MAGAASELAEARVLEHRQIAILASISRLYSCVFGQDLTQLEFRQASILHRISSLYRNFASFEYEAVTTGDPICAALEGETGVSCVCGRRSGGDEEIERYGGQDTKKSGGDFGQKTENGRVYESDADMVKDLVGEDWDQAVTGDCKGQGAERRLTQILLKAGATFSFKRVPPDYYERTYEERRGLLGATSVDHLCKSIVMVNTQAHESVKDCSDRNNSKYYLVVVQYTARLNAEKVRQFVYTLNNGKIPKKRFNLRLAPEEESDKLTGFEHNAVTPFGMLTDIPVILSDAIVNLKPKYFWLGGGEIDLKLGINADDFVRIINPFVVDCTY